MKKKEKLFIVFCVFCIVALFTRQLLSVSCCTALAPGVHSCGSTVAEACKDWEDDGCEQPAAGGDPDEGWPAENGDCGTSGQDVEVYTVCIDKHPGTYACHMGTPTPLVKKYVCWCEDDPWGNGNCRDYKTVMDCPMSKALDGCP